MSTKTKLYLAAAVIYLLFPIDVINDALIGIGQIDDVLLIALALWQWYSEYKNNPRA